MHPHRSAATALLASFLLTPLGAQSESKEPPAGAPWTMDFAAAHREALASGKPIFVYSTKTY